TGVLFHEQTPEALADAVARFETLRFDSDRIRQSSLRFGRERFRTEIRDYLNRKYDDYMQAFFGDPPPPASGRTGS
ncbi:MAG: hypothetical protein KJ579_05880, partial [Verrucomicrobia bacterium]|nr:hypothetical protein [Verrucomicrobiota bacterium]